MLVAGVDDAGRGSVIGPLVIAGVVLKEDYLPRLVQIGAKDSKLLSPRKRELLFEEIKKCVAKYHVIKLSPVEIDDIVNNGRKLHKLNWLEARTMAQIIEVLKPDRAYVDASDVLEERFKQQILENVSFRVSMVCEHKADRNYPVVGAASIIAKVERDHAIAEIANIYGFFGSGYPSDPRTMGFLEECIGKGEYPDFVRRSWAPAKKTRELKSPAQTKLS